MHGGMAFGLAVGAFVGGEYAMGESVAVLGDGLLDACYFYHVESDADNHSVNIYVGGAVKIPV